jgi:hypothetical protein
MKNPRTGTVSPSENSTNRGMRIPGSVLSEIPLSHEGQICIHCRTNGPRLLRRVGTGELALGCIFGVLLVGSLLFTRSALNSGTQHTFDHFFDDWVWHEPLDNWNL